VIPLSLAFTSVLAPGCGTLFFHNPQTVRVSSNVPGSLVIDKNQAILGKTEGLSGEFPLDRSYDHTLVVSAHGNEAATVPVRSRFSWWRILISLGGDIPLGVVPFPPVLWGVVGIITDVGSGSWRVLDDDVAVALRPRAELELPSEDAPPSTTRAASDSPPAAATRACPACDAAIDRAAQFCPLCGARLGGAAVKPCPICGEPRPAATAVFRTADSSEPQRLPRDHS
jgi:hypothetical protein